MALSELAIRPTHALGLKIFTVHSSVTFTWTYNFAGV